MERNCNNNLLRQWVNVLSSYQLGNKYCILIIGNVECVALSLVPRLGIEASPVYTYSGSKISGKVFSYGFAAPTKFPSAPPPFLTCPPSRISILACERKNSRSHKRTLEVYLTSDPQCLSLRSTLLHTLYTLCSVRAVSPDTHYTLRLRLRQSLNTIPIRLNVLLAQRRQGDSTTH